MVGDKLNFNWQEVFNKFSDDLANAFDLFTGNLKLTKVFKATIIEKINDTVYKVSYKNAEYRVKSYYDLIVGDIVWVCAPGGDWDSLFVQSYNGFLDRIVTTDKVVNNLNTNVAGTVLDGRMGKSLKDQLDQQNSNLVQMILGDRKILHNNYQVATTDEYGNCNVPFGYTFSDTNTCVIASVAYSYEQCSASVRGVTTTGFALSINVAGEHWVNKEITLTWIAIGKK